jgi:hypothetical protein
MGQIGGLVASMIYVPRPSRWLPNQRQRAADALTAAAAVDMRVSPQMRANLFGGDSSRGEPTRGAKLQEMKNEHRERESGRDYAQ